MPGSETPHSPAHIGGGGDAVLCGQGQDAFDRFLNTLTDERKKTGGPYKATGRTVVSNGGKTMTTTTKGTNADGKAVHSDFRFRQTIEETAWGVECPRCPHTIRFPPIQTAHSAPVAVDVADIARRTVWLATLRSVLPYGRTRRNSGPGRHRIANQRPLISDWRFKRWFRQDLSNLPGQFLWSERLMQKRIARINYASISKRIRRVAGY